MAKLLLQKFIPCEDGMMGRFDLVDGAGNLNVFVDNAEDLLGMPESLVEMDVYGISQGVRVFRSEAEYRASGTHMDLKSMIPTGTFTPGVGELPEERQAPTIRFSGVVTGVCYWPNAEEDAPNYLLYVEAYGMPFMLYLRHEGEEIAEGNIVSGNAWLYGKMEKNTDEDPTKKEE